MGLRVVNAFLNKRTIILAGFIYIKGEDEEWRKRREENSKVEGRGRSEDAAKEVMKIICLGYEDGTKREGEESLIFDYAFNEQAIKSYRKKAFHRFLLLHINWLSQTINVFFLNNGNIVQKTRPMTSTIHQHANLAMRLKKFIRVKCALLLFFSPHKSRLHLDKEWSDCAKL